MEIEKKNYFVVSRNLLNSNRWLCEKFTRGQAWIDLFGLAQHTDSYFIVRGIKVWVKRGQLGYSQITLAERWRWSRDKVRRYLKELENGGDIIQQNDLITTIITIVNYDRWQLSVNLPLTKSCSGFTSKTRQQNNTENISENQENNTTDTTTNKTAEKQQKNSKQDTYNNDNKKDNDNKNIVASKNSPTPKSEAIDFFEQVEFLKDGKDAPILTGMITEFMERYGVPQEPLLREIVKFANYWTEKNSTGTKQKWQKKETFEVKRRLATWFGNVRQFQGQNNQPKLIKIK